MATPDRPFPATATEILLSLLLDEVQGLRAEIRAMQQPPAPEYGAVVLKEPVTPKRKASKG